MIVIRVAGRLVAATIAYFVCFAMVYGLVMPRLETPPGDSAGTGWNGRPHYLAIRDGR